MVNVKAVMKENVFLITDRCILSGSIMMAERVSSCFSRDKDPGCLPGRCFGHVQPDPGDAGEIMFLSWPGGSSGFPLWSWWKCLGLLPEVANPAIWSQISGWKTGRWKSVGFCVCLLSVGVGLYPPWGSGDPWRPCC